MENTVGMIDAYKTNRGKKEDRSDDEFYYRRIEYNGMEGSLGTGGNETLYFKPRLSKVNP